MPRPKSTRNPEVLDYRHKGAKRKNNPEEGLATYLPEEHAVTKYQYDPHLDPQIVWAGKAEHTSFEIPVVPLHIHERITPKSIISILEKKREHQLRLFDEAEYPLEKRVDFYKHEMDWANRLILGDSLVIMNSLLTKELLGGKVQMIYMDPPYGIAYSSNFQPTISSREVKEGHDDSITREPEQIKAYRDTWELGIHSYLTYLRDRFLLCRELLHESGSIFVQINDENLHHVREVLDEIFGSENFCAVIPFSKTVGQSTILLPSVMDYLLWYARDKTKVKYRKLFTAKEMGGVGATGYILIESPDGKTFRSLTADEISNPSRIPTGWRVFDATPLVSQGYLEKLALPFTHDGQTFSPPPNGHWKTTREGMESLAKHNRLVVVGRTLQYKRYLEARARHVRSGI